MGAEARNIITNNYSLNTFYHAFSVVVNNKFPNDL
jgi:hypothetical protein